MKENRKQYVSPAVLGVWMNTTHVMCSSAYMPGPLDPSARGGIRNREEEDDNFKWNLYTAQ
mgnify:CR=1 FL=1